MASAFYTKYNAQAVTTPGAFLAIASLPAAQLPSGLYRIRCYADYVGTVGANEQVSGGNVSLYVGATAIPLGIPAVANTLFGPFSFDVNLDGLTVVSVGTGALAGTSGVTYQCILIADQQSLQGSFGV